jgi:hypothetical protein
MERDHLIQNIGHYRLYTKCFNHFGVLFPVACDGVVYLTPGSVIDRIKRQSS